MNSSWQVDLLAEDPQLAEGLAPADFDRASRHLRAHVVDVEPGAWPAAGLGGGEILGYLVLHGTLAMRTALHGRAHVELLGPGDVLQPWVGVDEDSDGGARKVDWQALTAVRVAVLDARFARVAAAYPVLLREVMHRLVLRSRRLNLQMAVNSVPRVHHRIHLMLWHFAHRWGRVTPDGLALDLPLTHQLLAETIGAQRPSVTTALGVLTREGALSRDVHGRWLLHGEPPALLADLYEVTALPTPAVS